MKQTKVAQGGKDRQDSPRLNPAQLERKALFNRAGRRERQTGFFAGDLSSEMVASPDGENGLFSMSALGKKQKSQANLFNPSSSKGDNRQTSLED